MTSDHATARDQIEIHGLAIESRVGVPAAERALPQRLLADFLLFPAAPLHGLQDDLTRTIDYAAVAGLVREMACSGERQLIETLAEDFCRALLGRFPLAAVEVRLRKFILPNTEWVAVRLRRGPEDFT